jgi:hypothetical protein
MSFLQFVLYYLTVDAVASVLVFALLYSVRHTLRYRLRSFLGVNELYARLESSESEESKYYEEEG